MDLDENLLATFGLISSSVIAIVANSLLLLVFCRRRGLRTISNRFVINLLFANVISSLFLLPMLAIDSSFLGATANPTVTSGAQQLHSHSHLNINITTTEYIQSSSSNNNNNNNSTSQSQQYKKLPLQEYTQQYQELSSQQYKELSLQQYHQESPSQQYQESPSQQYQESPSQHYQELPLQQYQQSPSKHYQARDGDSLLASSAQLIITEEETEEILTNNGETVIESAEEIVVDSVGDNLEIIQQTNVNYSVLYGNSVNNSYQRALVCFLAEFGVTFVCTACILSVLLIGMDQYFAVLHPLRYQSYVNKTRSALLVSLSWFSSVLFGVGGTFSNANIHYFKTCQTTVVPSSLVEARSITVAFSIFYVTVAILVPFLALCVIYVYIYSAAHKNSARVRKSTSINFNQTPQQGGGASGIQKTYSAPDLKKLNDARNANAALLLRTNSERVCKTILDNLKYKLSNASVFRYREENRTAKISLLVIFMVLTCYVPYGVSLVINSLSPVTKPSSTLSRFNALSLVLLVSSNVVSPFLFAYRNRRIQRELGKFFKLVPRHRSVRSRPIVRDIIATTNRQEHNETVAVVTEPFLATVNECGDSTTAAAPPQPPSIVECKIESESVSKKSILKRVCSSKNWNNYKKCTFITVPDSCLDARGSFSSASTQISMED